MNFREFIRNRIVVFDGAFGTVLQSKTGGKTGTVPEKLNLSAPELIAEIHREYAAAGADVITANTFGANEIKTGSRELADELIRAGVRLARREAGNKFVALDIGPLGRILEPMGDLPFGRATTPLRTPWKRERTPTCPDEIHVGFAGTAGGASGCAGT